MMHQDFSSKAAINRQLVHLAGVFALILAPVCSSASDNLHLIPRPREVFAGDQLSLASGLAVVNTNNFADDRFAAHDLAQELRNRGIAAASPAKASVIVKLIRADQPQAKRILSQHGISFTPAMHDEGYAITNHRHMVDVIAASGAGIFYGVQTLKQLIEGNGKTASLHTAQIRDWPAMRYRAVDDDLSRGPVPTLEFQKRQIQTLAAYKINIYSPYFEHAFSYNSTPLAGLPGGVITQQQAAELVRYAAQYHVTILPQQEAFGHLHHLLSLEEYQQLSETPLGMVLAPAQPGSLAMIRQWFQELAQVFPSDLVHIGADETFDLGAGQTASEVQQRGRGAVYVDFLKQIHSALEPLHKRLLFWGDMAMNEPDLVKTLPKDMIAVAWHYSPEPGGFMPWLQPYKQAGMETWVSPGANNWFQVYPDNGMTLLNVQGFVRDGQALGSTGMLMTSWYDDGEGLFLENWYGVLFAAAAAWQSGQSDISQYQNDYGPSFHHDSSGRINDVERELIAAHEVLTKSGVGDETDGLFWVDPWSDAGMIAGKKLMPYAHDLRMHAERALTLIAEVRKDPSIQNSEAIDAMDLGARRLDFIAFKFQSALAILNEYQSALSQTADQKQWDKIGRELELITSTDGHCDDLQQGYNYLREEYRDVWLEENRPYWLENILNRYDVAAQLWSKRSETFTEVQSRWEADHTLPSAQALGLPNWPISK
ncbi:MAG TPA: glycoside hydrolase family 20 zincin-like fold domain-containing protein [Terriglobales bacterium]|nr:glycoside hydrolase family 20 zincin-like fold domain-containing protein [Terriglobales bacterium]